jgi:signal transduction histidine kinase
VAALTVDWLLIPPVHSFRIGATHDAVQWLMLVLNGILVSALMEALHRVRRRLEASLESRAQAEENRRSLEAQLRQSQKLEAVGRLAGGVAHDFNNLMLVINGLAELALDRVRPGDPLRDDLESIFETGQRAASLTRQLLAFSRKQVLAPQALDLNQLVTGVSKMLRRLIGEDIELLTVLADDLGRVKADPGQIEQVLMNLAVNAKDAMPQGGRLSLSTTNAVLDENSPERPPDAAVGAYVAMTVTDTGCGMDTATRERLFEPFFTTKEPGKGTGLGLSTVYGIVKQSGGAISVSSAPGTGTTFTIYLPRLPDAGPDAAATAGPPPAALPAAGGRETILLVEDSPPVRKLVKRLLEMAGYTVLVATNGGEALQVLEQCRGAVHLLFTDAVLPGISGPELARRAQQLRPELRVLYTSGYTQNELHRQEVLGPGVLLLPKPYTREQLCRQVRAALDA